MPSDEAHDRPAADATGRAGAPRPTPAAALSTLLLALAVSDPPRALVLARSVLADDPDAATGSIAHQAAGIVQRDRGQVPAALHELKAALRLARRTGRAERVVDVSATYGAALVMAGRARDGLTRLDEAVAGAQGGLLARVRLRRAHVLSLLGRHDDALDDLRLALRTVRREKDPVWEAHVINNRCLVHLALGAVGRADADAAEAEVLYGRLGYELESVHAVHNRGLVALRRGDLPVALGFLDAAGARYEQLDVTEPDLVIDRCRALVVAGLSTEAVAMAETFLEGGADIRPVKRAELLQAAATAALAAGRIETARRRSDSARRLFASQQRDVWEARAAFVAVQARYAAGRRDAQLLATSVHLAQRLHTLRSEDAPLAYLLAGRLALDRRSPLAATASLAAAGRYRRRGPALQRAAGWLAVALEADEMARPRRVLAACRQGLDALDEHRLTFGGTELRAVATGHGHELASLALRYALGSGRPRALLYWSERWRATALTAPAVRPPDDAELASDLAAWRDAARRAEEDGAGRSTASAGRERDRWEAAVRRRQMRALGRGGGVAPFDVDALMAALAVVGSRSGPVRGAGVPEQPGAPAQAVVLVEIGGTLHSLVATDGRVHGYEVGPVDEARREADFACFSLRGAAFGRRVAPLDELGARLERVVLGAAARHLRDGPVVLVPPARLQGAPWALLPVLAEVPFTVAPSLAMWMRAAAQREPTDRRVALVVGPGLSGAASEVAALEDLHDDVTALKGADATAERSLASLEGAWLAHIAAHGSFRNDSPLFSSLSLHDGPLTVHDLDRLKQAPYRVLLSACDVGMGEAVGSDELLGLVTSLLALGTTGVLASVVPVNDGAAVTAMVRAHADLARGRSLGEASQAMRAGAARDPLAAATAASFTPWGA